MCAKEYQAKYWQANKKDQIERVTKRKNIVIDECREFLFQYLKEHPCCRCGEKDILVLDFDHLSNKYKQISTLLSTASGLDNIKKEIEKCQVLCSNCHRRKTAKERNTWKYRKCAEIEERPSLQVS